MVTLLNSRGASFQSDSRSPPPPELTLAWKLNRPDRSSHSELLPPPADSNRDRVAAPRPKKLPGNPSEKSSNLRGVSGGGRRSRLARRFSTSRRNPARQRPATLRCSRARAYAALARPSAKNCSPSRIPNRRVTPKRARSASLSSTKNDVYGVRTWNSSESATTLSRTAGVCGPSSSLSRWSRAHNRGRNELPASASLSVTAAAKRTSRPACVPVTTTSPF